MEEAFLSANESTLGDRPYSAGLLKNITFIA
jgi:hypothetical protein